MTGRTINILVLLDGRITRCSGVGIIKALRLSTISNSVFCAAPTPDAAALYLASHRAICPGSNDSQFIDWLIDYCTRNEIDVILPDAP